MSDTSLIPEASHAGVAAAKTGHPLEAGWSIFTKYLSQSMPQAERDALCDIYKRSYHLCKGMAKGKADAAPTEGTPT